MIAKRPDNFYNRKCHIIGIGIDEYKDKQWPKLRNCKTDIERFVNTVCKSFETFEDSSDYVTCLYNQDATKQLIRTTILGKLNSLDNSKILIIYFAGHGAEYENEGYLVSYEAKSDYKNPQGSSLISFKDLFNWIKGSNAWHIVLILDACHAGRIMNAKRATIYKNEKNFDDYINENIGIEDLSEIKSHKSAWVITSGSDDESVYDGNENGSPFSQALNKILEGSFKFNRPLTIGVVGSLMKRHFPGKYNQKPDFKRLSDILDYKSNKGEFVFEPLERKVRKEDEKIVTVNEAQREEPNRLKEPNFEKKRPISSPYSKTEEVQKEVYEIKEIEPIKSNIPFVTAFVLILSIMIFILTYEKKDVIERGIISTENTLNETPLSYYLPLSMDTPKAAILEKKDISHFAEKKKNKTLKPDKRIKHYVEGVIDITHAFNEDKTDNENPNIVFVGSFEDKSNAEMLLERLKKIGFQDAEILMKENLPYAIVVTGFYQFKSSAKAEVKALKKRGIEVYYSNIDLSKIYRKKN